MQDERSVVAALRERDEATFMMLVEAWHGSMVRVAGAYVPSRAVADEVVQETWLAVLGGIDRFEERSSLKTWIFRILANRARTRAVREAKQVPFSSLEGDDGPAVDPSAFGPGGGWERLPERPDERALTAELRQEIGQAIAGLPEQQRTVITLRDVAGLDGPEVADLLDISEGNQRVILHRARSRVRETLAGYLET